ncbi:uncharacterized protein I303_101910 [Kwoniella dejecticola CBS 10117]|uniref:PUB domain-containing protein n=1 Tax=Kwoniella dejecticola CBS 10117 TaxID=1296121 RepID=A0A1A6ACE9_9TREE|nr:uncharacterized protein I303_01954 [Kwoniella dejecticola CBS 10117]OBR87742.1 hypothetical protein I303_01954 [Kwoniella dejecticola CBS 10117]
MASPATSLTPAARRAAALAAIEARIRPPPSYDEVAQPDNPSDSGSASTLEQPSLSAPLQASTAAAAASIASPAANSRTRPQGGTTPAALAAEARALAGSSTPSRQAESAWRPTEKEDRDTRIKFSRLLDRGIVRDNNYIESADAVETLLKIATNIINSNDPKFRTLKSTNATIKNKVLEVKGGHDYLIALGFRTQTIDFSLQYIFNPTLKKSHELQIGAEVLKDHLKALQDRVELSKQSKIYGASVEAARKAAALADIEADREAVRARAAREKIVREAKEAKEREEREREAQAEAEMLVDQADEETREMRDAVTRPTAVQAAAPAQQGNAEEDEEEEEEEDRELPSYAEDRESRGWGGPGRRLGG